MNAEKQWKEATRLLQNWRVEVDAELVRLREYLVTLEDENWEGVMREEALLDQIRQIQAKAGEWLEKRNHAVGTVLSCYRLVKWIDEELRAIILRAKAVEPSEARKAAAAALKGGHNDADQGNGDAVG